MVTVLLPGCPYDCPCLGFPALTGLIFDWPLNVVGSGNCIPEQRCCQLLVLGSWSDPGLAFCPKGRHVQP